VTRNPETEQRLVRLGTTPGRADRLLAPGPRHVSGAARQARGHGATGTLSDLENGRTHKGTSLGEVARILGLRFEHVTTGKLPAELTEQDMAFPQPADTWPLPGIPRETIQGLTRVERSYLEQAMRTALQEIEEDRRARRSAQRDRPPAARRDLALLAVRAGRARHLPHYLALLLSRVPRPEARARALASVRRAMGEE